MMVGHNKAFPAMVPLLGSGLGVSADAIHRACVQMFGKHLLFVLMAFVLPSMSDAIADAADCFNEFELSDRPCKIKMGSSDIVMRIDGSLTSPDGAKGVQVSLPKDFYLESVRYELTGNLVVLVLSISDSESGSTLVSVFDPARFVLVWTTEVPSFNASPPLVTDGFVYLGAFGTVAKLDLLSGVRLWMHSGLYERETQAFNSFVQPRKNDDTIVFAEEKTSTAKYKGVREVRVRDSTGKLLSK